MGSAMALFSNGSPGLGSRARKVVATMSVAAGTAIAAAGAASPAHSAEVSCDKVASKSGSDGASGTASSPYRTPQKLVDSLSAGQTGCLREGIYAETSKLRITKGGSPGDPMILRSYPGERAEIVAQVAIFDTANHVTLTDLVLNGEGAPPCNANVSPNCTGLMPTLPMNGDDVTISNSEITNHNSAICVNAGTWSTERAVRLTIQGNRIHECGRLPATNLEHGVYLGRTNHVSVTDNLIYANADRGVQFYPEARNSYVARNVIDGNGAGVGFGGASGAASSDNVVEHNVITNSRIWNVYSSYPAGNPVGQRNVVRSNCIYGAKTGNVKQPAVGFTIENNLLADPKYTDRASGNFDLGPDSPCKGVLMGQDPSGGGPTEPETPGETPPGGGTSSGSGGSTGEGTPSGEDPIDTEVTQGPKGKTKKRRAAFAFEAKASSDQVTTNSRLAAVRTVDGLAFRCKLDAKQWKPCASPTRYTVRTGKHRFRVRATDDRGNPLDRKPARRAWKVKKRRR